MLLRLESLTKKFGGLVAVSEVDLEVEAGSIVGIVGPNGAGKTTLFNLVSGQLNPTSGRVYLRDREVTGLKPHRIARLGIGRTFQKTTLFDELPVKINLAIAYRMRTSSNLLDSILYLPRERKEAEDAARKVAGTMTLVGLTEFADHPAGSIPQAGKKRLAIGMALIGDPALLLLDEPTGGVGASEVSELIDLIKRIRELGLAICIIEHKMRMIMGLADRICVLNFGRKIAEGSPERVSSNPEVIEAYLGSGYRA